MASPTDKMKLARRHLERVQAAWDDPTDWADLSTRYSGSEAAKRTGLDDAISMRKSEAYGDVIAPDLDAEEWPAQSSNTSMQSPHLWTNNERNDLSVSRTAHL